MNTVWVVAQKELLDLFRDRRTLLLGLLLGPLLFPVFILGVGGLAAQKARTQLEKTLELPVVHGERAPNLLAFLRSQNIEPKPPPPDPERAIREQDHDVILVIPEDYAEQWRASRPARVELWHDASRQDSQIPVERVAKAVESYARQVGALRLLLRGLDPAVAQPVFAVPRDLSTPEARRGMILAFLPYLLILSAFLGGAYLVIDVTAGERERQSLEPLLATPASREAIMSGKIAAACAFGMLSLLLILGSFKASFWIARSLDAGPFGAVDVSWLAIAKLLLILFPMVLIGTTLLTLISASVKSVKEAQSYMSVLMLLPIIPTIVLLIHPVKNQLWMFAVPFLAQNQAIMNVLRGEPLSLAEWGVCLGSGLALGALFWLLAARLYHREQLAISA
ncbi:MAG: sodium ABC transporter permease [Lysobacterales bacterium]|jgi:sodium transport system permease protein|nr:MAG: sodium ABC transporter permease [Xanthomonadales bacterium]